MEDNYDRQTLVMLARLPSIASSDPIRAVKTYVEDTLMMGCEIQVIEYPESPYVIYEANVIFKEGNRRKEVASFRAKRKRAAEEGAARRALMYLCRDMNVLIDYINKASTAKEAHVLTN